MFAVLSPHLDERRRRLLAGAQARALGRGGIAVVARASGMARSTVRIGTSEVDQGPELTRRARRPGADVPRRPHTTLGCLRPWTGWWSRPVGRPRVAVAVDVQVDPQPRRGVDSARTVAELLVGMGYSLQATSKQVEGAQHPDRDGQFGYLNEQARAHLADSQSVISVDTKKKEVVGNLGNKGRTWQPKGAPVRVDVHDFPDPNIGKAIPY